MIHIFAARRTLPRPQIKDSDREIEVSASQQTTRKPSIGFSPVVRPKDGGLFSGVE